MSHTELRIPVETRTPTIREATSAVEPAFKIGEVAYYDTLPSEPEEKPRQTLLPMSLVGDWVRDYIAAHPGEKRGINWTTDTSGIQNPKFGSTQHYATVEYDEAGNLTKYLFDGVVQADGTLDPRTGIATPGSVVAPIEEVNGDLYVHCFWQWRPVAWDQEVTIPDDLTDPQEIDAYKAAQRGMWMLTVPGGFAQLAGDSPEAVAKREAIEEAGLAIDAPVFQRQTFNRASTETLVNVGYATFRRVGEELQSEGEKLIGSGKMAIRLDAFRSPDAMTAAAVNTARENLLYARSTQRIEDLEAEIASLRSKLVSEQPVQQSTFAIGIEDTVSQLRSQGERMLSSAVSKGFGLLRGLQDRGITLPDGVMERVVSVAGKLKSEPVHLPDGGVRDYLWVKGHGIVDVRVARDVTDQQLDMLGSDFISSTLAQWEAQHEGQKPRSVQITGVNAEGKADVRVS